MVITTKIKNFEIENKFIDLDKRISFLDLDIKRIMPFILELEQNKFTSINGIYKDKINTLLNLKYRLNLKKKLFIDILRKEYNIISENPLNSLILDKQQIKLFSQYEKQFINLLIKYKVVDNDLFLYQIKINLFFNNYNNIIKILNIDNDIKTIENSIKSFKVYIKNLRKTNPFIYNNPYSKINQLDLDYLLNFKSTKITTHIKEIFYFYLIKVKKLKESNRNDLNLNGQFKKEIGIITKEDILKCIENNHKNNIDNLNTMIDKRVLSLQTFILNKWF